MSFSTNLIGHFNYLATIVLMMTGYYVVMSRQNLIKRIIGLNIFQTSVSILYISMGKIYGGHAPILDERITLYSNPMPHVLILTAIVVGVATTAVGLALAVRINLAYGTINGDELYAIEEAMELTEEEEAEKKMAQLFAKMDAS